MLVLAHAPQPPPVDGIVSYQIGGPYPPAKRAATIERDATGTPVRGRYNICYVNAFQAQSNEVAWWRAHHPRLLVGVKDRRWHEPLLDTSTPVKRRALRAVVGRWIDDCARAGFQAVEPDNLDSWTRSRRRLTRTDNLAFARVLIARAHADGLAIAQKNAADVADEGRLFDFDFAIAEECQRYRECGSYTRAYGRAVIEIEYPDAGGGANFAAACRARGTRISIVYRDRAVTPAGLRGFVEKWCPVTASERPRAPTPPRRARASA